MKYIFTLATILLLSTTMFSQGVTIGGKLYSMNLSKSDSIEITTHFKKQFDDALELYTCLRKHQEEHHNINTWDIDKVTPIEAQELYNAYVKYTNAASMYFNWIDRKQTLKEF